MLKSTIGLKSNFVLIFVKLLFLVTILLLSFTFMWQALYDSWVNLTTLDIVVLVQSLLISLKEEKCTCRQGNYRVSLTSLVNPLDSCLNTTARPFLPPLEFGLTITWFALSASGTTSPFTLTSPVATFTPLVTLTWDKSFIPEVKI